MTERTNGCGPAWMLSRGGRRDERKSVSKVLPLTPIAPGASIVPKLPGRVLRASGASWMSVEVHSTHGRYTCYIPEQCSGNVVGLDHADGVADHLDVLVRRRKRRNSLINFLTRTLKLPASRQPPTASHVWVCVTADKQESCGEERQPISEITSLSTSRLASETLLYHRRPNQCLSVRSGMILHASSLTHGW